MYRIPEPKTPLRLPCPWRRLRFNLECIGWTQNELARRARLDDSAVRQMCRGGRQIPDEMAIWVEQLAALHRALSEPVPWDPVGQNAAKCIYPEFDPDDDEVCITPKLIPRALLEQHLRNERDRDGVANELAIDRLPR